MRLEVLQPETSATSEAGADLLASLPDPLVLPADDRTITKPLPSRVPAGLQHHDQTALAMPHFRLQCEMNADRQRQDENGHHQPEKLQWLGLN